MEPGEGFFEKLETKLESPESGAKSEENDLGKEQEYPDDDRCRSSSRRCLHLQLMTLFPGLILLLMVMLQMQVYV